MIKVLLLLAMLVYGDHADFDVHQITGQTCQEATKDYVQYLNDNAKALGIVSADINCKEIEINPSKTQNGST